MGINGVGVTNRVPKEPEHVEVSKFPFQSE